MSNDLLCPHCEGTCIWTEVYWSGEKGHQLSCSECGFAGPIGIGDNDERAPECWDCGRRMMAAVRRNGRISEPWWACICTRIVAVKINELCNRWAPLIAAGEATIHRFPWEVDNARV
jgi:hypothetical protein